MLHLRIARYNVHLLAGAVLPVWKELTDIVLGKEAAKSRGKPRVLRAVLEGGRKITGACEQFQERHKRGAVQCCAGEAAHCAQANLCRHDELASCMLLCSCVFDTQRQLG